MRQKGRLESKQFTSIYTFTHCLTVVEDCCRKCRVDEPPAPSQAASSAYEIDAAVWIGFMFSPWEINRMFFPVTAHRMSWSHPAPKSSRQTGTARSVISSPSRQAASPFRQAGIARTYRDSGRPNTGSPHADGAD